MDRSSITDKTPQTNSIDPLELEKFDRLAHLWWDDKGPMWPLHRLNRFRIGFITEIICAHHNRDASSALPFSGLQVLDVGCGGGILSETMAKLGASVDGIDISEMNIEIAKQHADAAGLAINYVVNTAESLAAGGCQYDVVLNMEVVEHVADLPLFMRACNSLVGDGGVQFVSTINRNPWAWFIAIFGAERVLRWLPAGTHEYSKLVKPAELEALLSADNFRVTARTGVAVNPFNKNITAQKSELVNYMVAAATGL